jgi:hypothetical protein
MGKFKRFLRWQGRSKFVEKPVDLIVYSLNLFQIGFIIQLAENC